MRGSICLRLVDRLERIRDHVSKHFVEKLSGSKVHAKTRGNLGYALVVSIDNPGCKRQRDDAVSVTSLVDQINELNRHAFVQNFHSIGANRQRAPALNHDLVCHQKFSLGTVFDIASLNARAFGVEGRPA